MKCVECKEFTKIECFSGIKVEKGDCFKNSYDNYYIAQEVENELYLISMDTFRSNEVGAITECLVSDIEESGFRFVMKYDFKIKECI